MNRHTPSYVGTATKLQPIVCVQALKQFVSLMVDVREATPADIKTLHPCSVGHFEIQAACSFIQKPADSSKAFSREKCTGKDPHLHAVGVVDNVGHPLVSAELCNLHQPV